MFVDVSKYKLLKVFDANNGTFREQKEGGERGGRDRERETVNKFVNALVKRNLIFFIILTSLLCRVNPFTRC